MKYQTIFICLLWAGSLFAQKSSGTITDSATGEAVIGCYVINQTTKDATVSNNYGYYSINAIKGNKIHFSFVGYSDTVIVVAENTNLNVQLSEATLLNEITILAEKPQGLISNRGQATTIQMKTVKQLPKVLGETDITKALQLLPGVQASSEGKSGMVVRGGSSDQNLVLLDGVPLYSMGHFADLFSVFNEDAINSATLHKGSAPANFGGRLSSVLDVRMKEGNNKKYGASASIGLMSAKFMIEGPILKEKSSFMVSGRKSFVQYFSQLFDLNLNYGFYDLNIKVNHPIGKRHKLYLSSYFGNDRLATIIEGNDSAMHYDSSISWGNKLYNARLTSRFNNGYFGTLNLSATNYSYRNFTETLLKGVETKSNFFSQVNAANLNYSVQKEFGNKLSLKTGIQSSVKAYEPIKSELHRTENGEPIGSLAFSQKDTAYSSFVFVNTEYKPVPKLKLGLGIRTGAFMNQPSAWAYTEPRISASYQFSDNISAFASYNRTSQPEHLLSIAGNNLPSDIWLPSVKNVKPATANQFSLGYKHSLAGNAFSVTTELFSKQMYNLIRHKPGTNLYGSYESWENGVYNKGTGTAKGFELLVSKNSGKLQGFWASTISQSTRSYDQYLNGTKYPFAADKLFVTDLVATYKRNNKVSFSATWNFSSGYPLNLAQSWYELENGEVVYNYDLLSPSRSLPYHRLDIGVNIVKIRKHHTASWHFGLMNAYNRHNYFLYFYSDMWDGGTKLTGFMLYSLLPVINYSIKIR